MPKLKITIKIYISYIHICYITRTSVPFLGELNTFSPLRHYNRTHTYLIINNGFLLTSIRKSIKILCINILLNYFKSLRLWAWNYWVHLKFSINQIVKIVKSHSIFSRRHTKNFSQLIFHIVMGCRAWLE